TAVEDRIAQTRAEGEHQLQTRAGHHAGPVHLGIVEHQRGQPELSLDRRPHVEPGPGVHQLGQHPGARTGLGHVVRSGHHHPVPDHPGHAHRHPTRLRQLAGQVADQCHQPLRRQRVGGGGPHRLGMHRPGGIEHRGLDATATAVDGERGRGLLHPGTIPPGCGGLWTVGETEAAGGVQPEEHADQDAPLVRARLDIAYDGAGFSGWARQPGLRTVQQEVEEALGRVLRLDPPPRLTVAGRTDAGVHARGQVAHVDLPAGRWTAAPGRSDRTPAEALAHRLAAVLARDVVVHAVREVPRTFDARFSALWRRSTYRISDALATRDPLARSSVLWHRRSLDEQLMNAAAHLLTGEHDFAAYCKPREGATTIRTLRELSWHREERGLVRAHVRADAFCHSMVRALVGACLAVGEGRRPVEWPAAVLRAGVRDSAVQVAPAAGLTLEEVGYPAEQDYAARARQARAVRTLP